MPSRTNVELQTVLNFDDATMKAKGNFLLCLPKFSDYTPPCSFLSFREEFKILVIYVRREKI